MSGDFKRSKIGRVFVTPELNQGESLFSASGLVSTGGTTTTITLAADSSVAALYPEGGIAGHWADLLNGCYVYFHSNTTTGGLQGKAYRITDTAWAADVLTITTETMDATCASGNTFYVLGAVAAKNMSMSFGKENLTRDDVIRDYLDKPSSVKGLSVVSGSFDLELIGLENALGNGDSHVFDHYSHIFEGFGSREIVLGTAVASNWGSATTGDVTGSSGLEAGDYIMIGGEVRRVTGVTVGATDTIVVTPAFSSAPLSGAEVNGCEKYVADDTGHRSFTIGHLMDDQMVVAKGALISFGINADFGQLVNMPVEFDAESYEIVDSSDIATDEPLFGGELSVNKPIPFITGEAHFAGTELCLASLEFSAGHGREEIRDTCENKRFFITSREASLSCSMRNKNKDLKTTWEESGTQGVLIAQIGNAEKNCVAIGFNTAQIQDPASIADNNGILNYDVSFSPVNDGDDDTEVNHPVLLRF